jgi:hypothetical protein
LGIAEFVLWVQSSEGRFCTAPNDEEGLKVTARMYNLNFTQYFNIPKAKLWQKWKL